MGRYCSSCGDWLQRDDYSDNQWRKGDGCSRCFDCVDGGNSGSGYGGGGGGYGSGGGYNGSGGYGGGGYGSSSGGYGGSSGGYGSSDGYSSGYSSGGYGDRGGSYSSSSSWFECHKCNECNQTFRNQNDLDMHRQVHRPRNVACPICGEQRFRSGANAVQHVESGYCSGCRGRQNARDQIYKYASSQQAMRPYMTNNNTPRLTYGGDSYDDKTPDFPYHCTQCQKKFQHMSQLLQHNDNKHGHQYRMLGY